MGVMLPKISNKALWKLGVAPKLALNDGQKRVESIFCPSLAGFEPTNDGVRGLKTNFTTTIFSG